MSAPRGSLFFKKSIQLSHFFGLLPKFPDAEVFSWAFFLGFFGDLSIGPVVNRSNKQSRLRMDLSYPEKVKLWMRWLEPDRYGPGSWEIPVSCQGSERVRHFQRLRGVVCQRHFTGVEGVEVWLFW